MKLTDYKALTFDCYGTLIDWESGMMEGLKPLTSKLGTALPRNAVLEAHARHPQPAIHVVHVRDLAR